MDLITTTQVLGNVGEFIGAIAVVATSFYLAFQARDHGASWGGEPDPNEVIGEMCARGKPPQATAKLAGRRRWRHRTIPDQVRARDVAEPSQPRAPPLLPLHGYLRPVQQACLSHALRSSQRQTADYPRATGYLR